MSDTVKNASQMPRIYYCRHMQPGIARYENETILVDTDGVKNLIASAKEKGIPIYIGHKDVDLKNIKEDAVGYTGDSFYNELDGWAWFKMIVVDDAGHEAIRKGWSVSNAYIPSEWGGAGTKINCPYKREVRNGEFTHLAIVPDPRYEGACIMTPDEYKNYQSANRKKLDELKNSKETRMFKLFKTKREEVTGDAVDLDTHVELENGKSVSIRDMVDAVVKNSKKQEQLVEVNGEKITVEELVNAYTKMNGKKKAKKNESPEDKDDGGGEWEEEGDDEIGEDKMNKKTKKNKKEKKNAEEEEDDCMSNDSEDDDEDYEEDIQEKRAKKNKKEKKNSKGLETQEIDVDDKYFDELRNAHLNANPRNAPQIVTTMMDGLQRGKLRYGSKNGNGRIN